MKVSLNISKTSVLSYALVKMKLGKKGHLLTSEIKIHIQAYGLTGSNIQQ